MSQASIARKRQTYKTKSHLARVKRLSAILPELRDDPEARAWALAEMRRELRQVGGQR
jgi:hypothetical protein